MSGIKQVMLSIAGLSLAAIISVTPLCGQAEQAQAAKAPQAKTQAEYNAYMAMYNENQDLAKKAGLAESFLAAYPDSDFKMGIYQIEIFCYLRLNNPDKVIEAGTKFDTDFPQADAAAKKSVYQPMMQAYQMKNNFEKTVEYGEKLLALDPNDLPALLTLCAVLPERLPPATEEAKRNEQLAKALDYSQRALAQANIITGGAKPAQMSDEQWTAERNRLLAQVNSSLALVYLNKKDYAKSAEYYEQSTSLVKNNPIDFYRLGIAYSMQARALAVEMNNVLKAGQTPETNAKIDDLNAKFGVVRDKAISALAKSAVLKGATEAQATNELKKLYANKNDGKMDGLDAVLSQAAEELKK